MASNNTADIEKALEKLHELGAIPYSKSKFQKQKHPSKKRVGSNFGQFFFNKSDYATRKAHTFNKLAKLSRIYGVKNVRQFVKAGINANFLYELLGSKKSSNPQVSIVIPTYSKTNLLIGAVLSIKQSSPKTSYEVVVVDNGNNPSLELSLDKVVNVNYIKTGDNLGFVGGCNLGAKNSRGEILVFLNDDTRVLGNWLDSLVATLGDKNIGLAGSKLIYPDGKLQEAGGIIFKDGTGNNYGKFSDPLDFRYNYACDVDYISGASIAIKKDLFLKLGAFDSLYSPAYYEDTDLCFKVRKAGYRVVYQPLSVAVHYEGATAGTDTSSGYKKYQEINKAKFQNKWKKELSEHYSPAENIFKSRTRSYKANILFLENSIPEPDKDSGSLREFTVLKILIELGYHVTFWSKDHFAKPGYTSDLQQLGIEVVYATEKLQFETLMRERQDIYEYVFLVRPHIAAEYVSLVQKYQTNSKIIYDTVDLHFLRTNGQAKVENSKKLEEISKNWEILEKALIKRSDVTIVVSESEKSLLEKEGFKNIIIVSNIHDNLVSPQGFEPRKNLFFIGSFEHDPNVDAVIWFCKIILPLVREKLPDVQFYVAGSGDLIKIKALSALPGVKILGFVEDPGPYFQKSRVFVAPLRFGAGVKGKIGQSMAMGLPLVTTGVGAEGSHLRHETDCLVADNAKEFAEAVIRLYSDEKLWLKLQKNAQKLINKYYSEKVAEENLVKILKR